MTPIHRRACPTRPQLAIRTRPLGFTLVELMVVVVLLAMITAIALPSYSAYVKRSRVPAGLEALQAYATRMEQRFQDSGNYASGADCALSLPSATNYSFACALSGGGTGFTLTATGSGVLAGYGYSIDHNGTRITVAHPNGLPGSNCWSLGGGRCDV
jgi:type IV pilus assembly protein PilE